MKKIKFRAFYLFFIFYLALQGRRRGQRLVLRREPALAGGGWDLLSTRRISNGQCSNTQIMASEP